MKTAIKFHGYVTRGYPCLPGYPTLVLVAGGKRYDFRGGRMRHLGGAMVGAMVILWGDDFWIFHGKSPSNNDQKWMRTGGSPILGNPWTPHIHREGDTSLVFFLTLEDTSILGDGHTTTI